MKLSAVPLTVCLLTYLACGKEKVGEVLADTKISELDKLTALRNYKQSWTDHHDNFLAIQKRLQSGTIEWIWAIPLGIYDPSIRMPNQNEVAFTRVKLSITSTSWLPLPGNEYDYYKVLFKPRNFVQQKVEHGAFEIANFLNMPGLIPPTVRFNADGKNGSLSYFVDADQGAPNPWKWDYKSSDKFEVIQPLLEPTSLNNFYTFAYVFGLWDLKWANTLLIGQSSPYSIMSLDNESLMSPVYAPKREHFYVCWKQDSTCPSLPYEDLSSIETEKFILRREEIPYHLKEIKRFFIKDKSLQKLPTEEKQEKATIKIMESFLWGKNSIPCFFGKKGLWLQLYADYPLIPAPKPHLKLLKPQTITSLKALQIDQLRSFFQDQDATKSLFSDNHYKNIIARAHSLLESENK